MFETPIMQGSLFGRGQIGCDTRFATLERTDLGDGAWLDHAAMWLSGDQILFGHLVETAPWRQPVVQMYDREVLTPRLVARFEPELHESIPRLVEVLSDRYGMQLDQISAGWYRDGHDSVAFHGDRIARELQSAIVATISLGGVRRFLIRPKTGGESRVFSLGHGDLVVMGGSCQRTHEHAVPKSSGDVEPRIALMFRHTYE